MPFFFKMRRTLTQLEFSAHINPLSFQNKFNRNSDIAILSGEQADVEKVDT